MIAKEVAARKGPGSFGGLVTYLLDARGRNERVGQVHPSNCVSVDPESVVLEVANTQAYNQRARDKTYHLILSFREAELSPDILHDIEQRACDALGFGEHQRLSVLHHDTDHTHLHIAINRVHPTRHTVHCPSYSKLALDRVCTQLEAEYGLSADNHLTRGREHILEASEALRQRLSPIVPSLQAAQAWPELHAAVKSHGVELKRRGNGFVFVDGSGASVRASSVAHQLGRASLERRLGPFEGQTVPSQLPTRERRTPDHDRLSGEESMVGWVQRRCGAELGVAQGWAQLHQVAQAHGLTLKARGNGLVFVDSRRRAVKASSISRQLSLTALHRRFGSPFEPAQPQATGPRAGADDALLYSRQPAGQHASALYERFVSDSEAARLSRRDAIERLREQHERDRQRLRTATRHRWAAAKLMINGPITAKLWHLNVQLANRRDVEALRRRHREAFRSVAEQHPCDGWVGWLQRQASHGDAEALSVLRRHDARRNSPANCVRATQPTGARLSLASVRGVEVDAVTPAGTVIYTVPNGTVRDTGTELSITTTSVRASAAFLEMARALYGRRLGVRGDDAFRKQLARTAAVHRIDIEFADPALERERQRLQQELPHGGRRRQEPESEHGPTRHTHEHPRGIRPYGQARRRSNAAFGRRAEPRLATDPPRAPTEPNARVRSLSEIRLVGDSQEARVLLPAHARPDVDERGPTTHRVVRRAPEPRPMTPRAPRRGRGR